MTASDDSLALRLLEELVESGRPLEEVCAAHPELAPEVERRRRLLAQLEAELDVVFPPHADQADAAGTRLPVIPGYSIERELGRGGMGVVYRARHERLQRTVALKMLLAGPFASPRELVRFRREAELVAQLRHPNIVPVYDVGEVDGRPYFTMELVEGGSLADVLARGGLSPNAACILVCALARAMDSAHQQGIVHRDLKPGNVLLDAAGAPKVSDFGLARRFEASGSTLSGANLGTPSYMAPEQIAGPASAVGPAADIHALGVILYEALTGHQPYSGRTAAETTHGILEVEPLPPRHLVHKIPKDLETVCLQCLRKEPHRRYATAQALADDLERFANGQPVGARRIGIAERAWRWCRRRPAFAAAAVAVLVLTAALLATALAVASSRATALRAADEDLRRARESAREGEWETARTFARTAATRLEQLDAPERRTRLLALAANLELAARLEAVRGRPALQLLGSKIVRLDHPAIDSDYGRLLDGYALDAGAVDVATVAQQIEQSDVRLAFVEALDDWAVQVTGPRAKERRQRLLSIARLVDPDPWRDRAREAEREPGREALAELAAAADVDRQSAPLLLSLAGHLHAAGGDARPLLLRVLAKHPQDTCVLAMLGFLLIRTDPAESVRFFEAIKALQPQLSTSHANLGLALAVSGRLQEGKACLNQALALDPGHEGARINLARCLSLEGHWKEALAEFDEHLRHGPSSAHALASRGAALLMLGRGDEARASFESAQALEPDLPATLIGRAVMLLNEGKFAAATALLERARVLEPEEPSVYYNLALILARQKRWEEAIELYRSALAKDPAATQIRSALARALDETDRVDDALAQYREALRARPKDPGLHCDLGMLLAKDWHADAAIVELTRALEIDPTWHTAQAGLARAFLMQGRFEEACSAARSYAAACPPTAAGHASSFLRQCERMLELERGMPNATSPAMDGLTGSECMFLARGRATNKSFAEAVAWYKRALDLEPQLTHELRHGARSQAAAAAVQAAAASDEATHEQRRSWREQALAWLRDDLADRMRTHSDTAHEHKRLLVRYAERWSTDPELAPVRDPAQLKKLPRGESGPWLLLWCDLGAWLEAAKRS